MNLKQYPVFQKDLRILSRHALGALVVQGLIVALVPLLNEAAVQLNLFDRKTLLQTPLCDWFPKMQVAINLIIALTAAAYWSVEERAGRYDLFLRRLPVSHRRVWSEKMVAGVTVVVGMIVCQWLWSVIASLLGATAWAPTDSVGTYLAVTSILAYFVGLPLSGYFSQSISVVLSGLIVMYSGIWGYALWDKNKLERGWFFVLLVAVFLLYLCVTFLGTKLRRERREPWLHSGSKTLVMKQIRENMAVFILTILAALAVLILGNHFLGVIHLFGMGYLRPDDLTVPTFALMIFSVILQMVLGVTTYNTAEKNGLRCVLYHHPISRSRVFGLKLLTHLAPALILSLSIAFLTTILSYRSQMNDRGAPAGMFIALVQVGLVPFFCGVLMTHGMRFTLYAFFITIPELVAVLATGLYFYSFWILYSYMPNIWYRWDEDMAGYPAQKLQIWDSGLLWIPFLFLVGLALAAWSAATDRRMLAGTAGYRLLHISRLFLFVLAIIVILVRTGWRDLFFLFTGMDIGIG